MLEGTIRWDRSGEGHGRVRITPQLIKVADDSHVWSERYDRVLEDIFTVQSDIAEQVLNQLQATILEPERRLIEARPTDNMEAYQAYLLGVQYFVGGTEEWEQRLAAEMLERAVELDPEFAVAHAMLSEAHSRLYHYRFDFTSERLNMARMSAEDAMKLRPDLPEGHRALGYFYYWGHRDYDRALEHFAASAEGLPNDANLLGGIFYVSRRQGRWHDAVQALDRWRQLDPQAYSLAWHAHDTHQLMRNFERAEEELRRAIGIAPNRHEVYCDGAWTYFLWDGTTDRAWRLLESAPSLESRRIEYTTLQLDMFDRNPESALARLQDVPGDGFSLQLWFVPRDLLECMCLFQMNEVRRGELACESVVKFLNNKIEERPHDHRLHIALGHALALLGQREAAVRAGEHGADLIPISKDALDGGYQAIELAKIYTRVGRIDKALDLIDELLSIPCSLSIGLLRLDPVWDPLRDHPRFQALLEEYEEKQ